MKLKSLLGFLIIISTVINCSIAENEVYLLPDNYTGYVIIIFDQEEGQETEYKNNNRVYRIPENGILKTKFKQNNGWAGLPKFYYKSIRKENELPYSLDFNKMPKDSVMVIGRTSGNANKDLQGKSRVSFSYFFAGNKQQIRKYSEQVNKINFIELADN